MFSNSLRRTQQFERAQSTSETRKFILGLRLIFIGFILCALGFSVPVGSYGHKFDILNDILGVFLIGCGVSQIAYLRVSPIYTGLLTFVKAVIFFALLKAVYAQFIVYNRDIPYTLFEFINLAQFAAMLAFGWAILNLCQVVGLYKSYKSWLVTFISMLFIYGVTYLSGFIMAVWVAGATKPGVSFSFSNLDFGDLAVFLLVLLVSLIPIYYFGRAITQTKRELTLWENSLAVQRLTDFWRIRPRFSFANSLRSILLTGLALAGLALLTGLPTLLSSAATETLMDIRVGSDYELGLAIDKSTGDILVAAHSSIERYNSAGKLVQEMPVANRSSNWFGNIITDQQGFIYVTDLLQDTVYKYSNNGQLLGDWQQLMLSQSPSSTKKSVFQPPTGLATDQQGFIYGAATNYIFKYSNTGKILQQFERTNGVVASQVPADVLTRPNYKGLAVDKQGNVYVADSGNDQVMKFNAQGKFVKAWGSHGQRRGQFYMLYAIAIDSKGLIYVADRHNHRIQVFDEQGNFVKMWGSKGQGAGQFVQPVALAIDSADNVYVLDDTSRLQKFRLN